MHYENFACLLIRLGWVVLRIYKIFQSYHIFKVGNTQSLKRQDFDLNHIYV